MNAADCLSTPEQLVESLKTGPAGDWFKRDSRWREVDKALKRINKEDDPNKWTHLVSDCLGGFWREYAGKTIAELLLQIPRLELALSGLEFKDERTKGYRDHYVHMFLTFVLGSTVIAQALAANCDLTTRAFSVVSEDEFQEGGEWPFTGNYYKAHERLLFLWTLAATFHDVGIPVAHLQNLVDGLNRYATYFGLNIEPVHLEVDLGLAASLPYYIGLMAELYEGAFKVESSGPGKGDYCKPCANPYVQRLLERELGARKHGALSAIGLFRGISPEFMIDRDHYDLDVKQFGQWTRHVLENDIARAALAIALHSADHGEYPKLFPLRFDRCPFTWLLVVCDQLQEFLRAEGTPYPTVNKMKTLPKTEVSFTDHALNLTVTLLHRAVDSDKAGSVEDLRLSLESHFRVNDVTGTTHNAVIENALNKYWDRHISTMKKRVSFASTDGGANLVVRVYLEKADHTVVLVH